MVKRGGFLGSISDVVVGLPNKLVRRLEVHRVLPRGLASSKVSLVEDIPGSSPLTGEWFFTMHFSLISVFSRGIHLQAVASGAPYSNGGISYDRASLT